MSSLPISAVLATWLDAVRSGRAGPDDLADAVRGSDPRHLVVGLPARQSVGQSAQVEAETVIDLHELPQAALGRVSLALPAPGDPVGLGGPPELNFAAIEAGEAVVVGSVGLVPEVDARTVVWRAHPADPVPWVDERETAIELRTTLIGVTRSLVDLDVASWQPEIPDLLMNLRNRPPLPLPPGTDARRVETIERASLCLEIVDLAASDDGGAVTAYEMQRRRAALGDLGRAARRALVGACSGRTD
ncbi:MAG: hypothetical protein ABWY19_12725 [Marmoricola sp.]